MRDSSGKETAGFRSAKLLVSDGVALDELLIGEAPREDLVLTSSWVR
jgi:hypothetical protein